ncbi:prostaglandin E synthase 2-like [Mytilus trossulus]|uniref:prostaglandin E synthase 2-like n=1 Tax=Mytilus trossulus TaxID=6551 RepID=UPI003005A229
MAAPMRKTFHRKFHSLLKDKSQIWQTDRDNFSKIQNRSFQTRSKFFPIRISLKGGIFGTLTVAGAVTLGNLAQKSIRVYAAVNERLQLKPSREVRVPEADYGLKLTMYQFTSCPFCCKLRSVLDYYGFSYDIIEVNSVNKKQIKWSDYKKVPILVCEDVGKNGCLQLNDSTVIISILQSYLLDRSQSLEKLASYYPALEGQDEKGKKTVEFQNKYFLMYQQAELTDNRTKEQYEEERKWRRWTDSDLVHMLSPNVYRTPSESLETFRHFDKVGEWEKNFSSWERTVVIYVGASVMWVMGKIIKRKYGLKDEVRDSLYDSCRLWTKTVGKRKLLGGDKPNLADLSVYGVLTSIEGCQAFEDTLNNTKIGPWFYRMKDACINHKGSSSSHHS